MACGVMYTIKKLESQCEAAPSATPLFRVRSGMISEAYIHETGRIPSEKKSKNRKVKAINAHCDC